MWGILLAWVIAVVTSFGAAAQGKPKTLWDSMGVLGPLIY